MRHTHRKELFTVVSHVGFIYIAPLSMSLSNHINYLLPTITNQNSLYNIFLLSYVRKIFNYILSQILEINSLSSQNFFLQLLFFKSYIQSRYYT